MKTLLKKILTTIAKGPTFQKWLKNELLLKETKEIYRDEKWGFVFTAYTENKDQYRIPHDHGDGWVIYTVVSGIMEMGSYSQDTGKIVRGSSDRLQSGESRVYLPGDIHDTRCLSDRVIILRFTSCDLKIEEREGRMKRYPLISS
jgi:CRP-like cAMP-binding protein